MEMTVWVDDWQMQCCGTPFSVGDEVSWNVKEVDVDWFSNLFGPEAGIDVDGAEEHHTAGLELGAATTGKVTGINAVHCRYAPSEDDRTLSPVQGSAVLAPITSADGWNAAKGEHRFVGYLVRLTVPQPPASS
jgi:hypothetical protein